MIRKGVLAVQRYVDTLRYGLMFWRHDWGGLVQTVKLDGKAELEDFLKHKLPIPSGTADRLLMDIEKHNLVYNTSVELSDELRFALGLVSPDEGLTRSQTA